MNSKTLREIMSVISRENHFQICSKLFKHNRLSIDFIRTEFAHIEKSRRSQIMKELINIGLVEKKEFGKDVDYELVEEVLDDFDEAFLKFISKK